MPFWVVDYLQSKSGKPSPVIMGGRCFHTRDQAQEYADDANLSPRAQIYDFPTPNESKATHYLKGVLIKELKSLDKGMVNVRHRGNADEV